jgi:hypothetical protein
MSTDWLPRTRAARLEMAKRWYPLVNTQKTAWKIPATEVTRLDAAITRVDEEQADFVLKATPGNRARVRDAFNGLVEVMRFFKTRYFLTPPLDYGDYFDLGLTPPDTTKTPSEAPTTIPEIEFITAVIRELTFRFRDFGARRWALPPGVHGIEFVWLLTDERPGHISALRNVEILSSGPFTLTFDEEKRGHRVFYAARWLGPKKQPGPWSDIESAVIP